MDRERMVHGGHCVDIFMTFYTSIRYVDIL